MRVYVWLGYKSKQPWKNSGCITPLFGVTAVKIVIKGEAFVVKALENKLKKSEENWPVLCGSPFLVYCVC